ncbi:putative spermidine/putrescine transport system ATP-binding protein [Dongia mobilis]|uniref:Spermidine/putrescine import ATP-binding protein PotA n=1 Tax=Dongia mobilis TaxID=578943 RepID=A0A4R6WWP4_9PROT|nr:ABC transporter ATP-binding protein [Dongia mobilis]TDQ84107.1 putative spermidine/putrescine transport system ATP-binding protein [Dongia mobilis]
MLPLREGREPATALSNSSLLSSYQAPGHTDMSKIVEIDGVSKIYGGSVVAVDDLTLAIKEGEFVTLLGPSGCGKTTLLRMLAGFESPDRGIIRLAGEDVTSRPPYRRDVNMVFQDYALFPHLSVAKNVAFGLERQRLDRTEIGRRVADALSLVGLADKAERRPHELSGGQRQRVALARAIVRRPKVLLLDEPLSALDANLREAMQVELKHLHEKLGLTFVMVTHDQTEALVMSDRIVLMKDGRIAQMGEPAELYNRPASPYVASFIGTTNLLPVEVRSVADGRAVVALGGRNLELPAPAGLVAGHAALLGIRPEKLRLETDGTVGACQISVAVEEGLFHGNAVRLRCLGEDGSVLLVDLQLSQSSIAVPARGSRLQLSCDPTDLYLFAGDDR